MAPKAKIPKVVEPKEKKQRISTKGQTGIQQCAPPLPAGEGDSNNVDGSQFMEVFQDMAKSASETKNQTVLRMSEDGFLLVVSHREAGNYSCQAMDIDNQCTFMDHVYGAAVYDPPLLQPYDFAEIGAYELKHGVVVPPLMKHYLTKISRESCCDSVRTVVDLDIPPTESHFIHNSSSGPLVEGSEAEMVQVSTLQYTHNKMIIVKGPGSGLMVVTNDEKKGAYEPLWMSIFLPCGTSVR